MVIFKATVATAAELKKMAEHEELGWSVKLLYLGAFIGILVIAGLLTFALCYFTASNDDEDEKKGKGKALKSKREAKGKQQANKMFASGSQTMVSTLTRSAKDSDVILATAMSAIPLKELGGSKNDIIVDVNQVMYLNKDEVAKAEQECVVCKNLNDVAWNQVSCLAQTTIGVLVYKRALAVDNKLKSAEQKLAKEEASEPLMITTNLDKTRSVSNLSLAPAHDSRISRDISKSKSLGFKVTTFTESGTKKSPARKSPS